MDRYLSEMIKEKALELGYEACGIIQVKDMAGFEERVNERLEHFPENETRMAKYRSYAFPREAYPWAESVVVCVQRYGKYRMPAHLEGRIGKCYLMDGRINPETEAYQASSAFEKYLGEMGFRTEANREFGITAVRWAGQQAGLGIMRKNNFFYSESGSWVFLETWLIDRKLELIGTCRLKPCPDSCTKCVDACPTGSLCAPYRMKRDACISYLTTWQGHDWPSDPLHSEVGTWMYGCDACQDVCPHNAGKWTEEKEFPGVSELGELLYPEVLVGLSDDVLREAVQPKLWYPKPDEVWKFRCNALNAMRNAWDARYEEPVRAACEDSDERVRKMARWVLDQVGAPS